MLYEYITVSQHGLSVPEVLQKLNDLGEEGFRLVPQNNLSLLVFERDITEYDIAVGGEIAKPDSDQYQYISLILMSALTLLVLIGLVIGSIHWLR